MMLKLVFHLHGFPKGVVSDKATKFTTRFCKAFCQILGAQGSIPEQWPTKRMNQELRVVFQNLPSS